MSAIEASERGHALAEGHREGSFLHPVASDGCWQARECGVLSAASLQSLPTLSRGVLLHVCVCVQFGLF